MNDTTVIAIYIFYNLIYALFSYPLGAMADRIGLKNVFIFGLLFFATVYFAIAFTHKPVIYFLLFFIYGIFAAATEGITKAWISNIADKKDTATAIGTYTAFQSICTLLASSIAGFVWYRFSAEATFILTGSVTVIVIIYILRLKSGSTLKSV